MPDLTNTVRWVEYVPDLLGNRDAPVTAHGGPFYFLLHGSMSKEQLRALEDRIGERIRTFEPLPDDATEEQKAARAAEFEAEVVERYAQALEKFIRLGDEPLTVDGRRIDSLKAYLELTMGERLVGAGAFLEVVGALRAANTLSGQTSFSSGRLSGGFTSTGRRRPAGRTVAR